MKICIMKLVKPTIAMLEVYIYTNMSDIFSLYRLMARRNNKQKKATGPTLQIRINTGDPTMLHMFVVNLMD